MKMTSRVTSEENSNGVTCISPTGEKEGADNDCQAMNTYDSSPHLSSPVGEEWFACL